MSFINALRDGYSKIRHDLRMYKKYYSFHKNHVFIIGEPRHGNIGDSAIAEAERNFINDVFGGNCRISDVFMDDYKYDYPFWDKLIQKKDIICMNGGGNFGDLWYEEELFREEVIKRFPNNRIIMFPQSMLFSSAEKLKRAVEVYNGHRNLTIMARDKISYDSMKKSFNKCKILFTPDIVLSYGKYVKNDLSDSRENIGLFMRNDLEREINDESAEELKEYLKKKNYHFDESDMVDPVSITIENRAELVKNKFRKISGYRLVITDRLHAMIFCAITKTPCIVFANNHHKVTGCYEWLKSLDYIRLVSSVSEAAELIDSFYNKKEFTEELDLSDKFRPIAESLLYS